MVVPKDVQRAVNHQSQNLLAGRNTLPLRIVASDFRTNVDVPNHGTTFSGSPEPERNHIRRTAVAKVAAIKIRHRRPSNERDRQHRIAHAIGL
jgi:hypothetical protein